MLLRQLVAVVACLKGQAADTDLDIGRIELHPYPGDLLLKIFGRLFGVRDFLRQLLPCDFQLVELIIERRQARPALGTLIDRLGSWLRGCIYLY
ncbi:hypothetical protein [Sinorhizobium chiapasense]|uniref:Transposase n=1 Tax=Sinorhizobium chiapasense TaxID=501572 RepID=A0ABZ2B7P3_9HYPH